MKIGERDSNPPPLRALAVRFIFSRLLSAPIGLSELQSNGIQSRAQLHQLSANLISFKSVEDRLHWIVWLLSGSMADIEMLVVLLRRQVMAAIQGHDLDKYIAGKQFILDKYATGCYDFCMNTKPRVHQLLSELKSIKKANRTMGEYLLHIKAISDALAAIGSVMFEHEKIQCMLEGLPEEYTWIYPLKKKSKAFQTFVEFKQLVELQLGYPIKSIQYDWGGEFRSFTSFVKQHDIIHRLSCPYSHNQNGSFERKYGHITELRLSMLAHASLPVSFWEDSFTTATYIINRLPCTTISGVSLYTKMFNSQPRPLPNSLPVSVCTNGVVSIDNGDSNSSSSSGAVAIHSSESGAYSNSVENNAGVGINTVDPSNPVAPIHSMVTRSMASIFKPNIFVAYTIPRTV
ncbi:Retrovirus-related Pol polyprotein from transposon TNT 1-94 [Senna tora]|uniref:Retrovirus-related Pol polyprotein from transposon TNT 1-94 n=1 Tax=Senna tora TaxID=362788 RepID=A0A834WB11_9FABA|nr:Retrovirus-related Pol polyprotein from transposon TNT 1-94 [Senna tora]